MWSSASASLHHHHHALLQLPVLRRTPKPSLLLPLVSDSQFSGGGPIFSAAKQGRRLVVVVAAAKSAGSKDSAEQQKWMNEGLVTESLPNGMFRIRLDNSDMIIGYISGKIRKSFIRILPGDRVKVEVSRYDSTRGRIVYRLRSNKDPS